MTAGPTLGLALIARDEEENLPGLLVSCNGAFDQVVLVDTGSTDRTVELFELWAAAERERNPDFTHKVGHFEWIDDFAAARNAADALLGTDWLVTADADDEIEGAGRLRALAAAAPERVVGIAFPYLGYHPVVRDPEAEPLIYIRMARRGAAKWQGRVHEGWAFPSGDVPVVYRGPVWRHRVSEIGTHRDRNRQILRKWIEDEPENPSPLAMLVFEEMWSGQRDRVLAGAERFRAAFADQMTSEESQASEWALEGLRLAVDESLNGLVTADVLLQAVFGSVAGIHSQAHSAIFRGTSGQRTILRTLPDGSIERVS